MSSFCNLIILLLLMAVIAGCTASQKAFSKGEDFENEGKYEEAMLSYAEAYQLDPTGYDYRVRFLKIREKAAETRAKRGQEFFSANRYAEAYDEFMAAAGINPTFERYRQFAQQSGRLRDGYAAYQEGIEFEKGHKLKEALLSFNRALQFESNNKTYQEAYNRVSALRRSRLEGQELNLKSTKPITLKFKDAKLKDVFAIVTQLSGITFVFDEGVKDQNVTVYMENATFNQALELLTNMFKLGRKVLNESAVILYPKTPEKVKQYEDLVLRTFNLSHMDAKKAVNLIRTMLQVKKIYVNEETNSVVVRDAPSVVDVIERVLEASDVPEPEVQLDVEILDITRSNESDVGLKIDPSYVQMGAFSPSGNLMSTLLSSATPITTTTTDTITKASPDTLVRAFQINGYGGYMTVPTAAFHFAKSHSKGEVLANPKIRVKNKEKSKFNVGTREPITTTNTTNSTVSVNVQYIDVGIKVSAEPTIQRNNDVLLKLGLEVSQVINRETLKDGSIVATIGTRNLDTVLSLKEGETTIIAGLIGHEKTKSGESVAGLADIPLIGKLFTKTATTDDKKELIMAITPKIIRGVTIPQLNIASFISGKEDEPSLVRALASFDQDPQFEGDPKPVTPLQQTPVKQPPLSLPAGTSGQPQSTPPATGQPGVLQQQPPVPPVKPQPLPVTALPPQPAAATAPATVPASVPTPPVKPPEPQLRPMVQIGVPGTVTVGKQFSVEIRGSDLNGLVSAPFVLTYDPVYVEFLSAAEGLLLKKDGGATSFQTSFDPAAGTVTVNLSRASGMAANGNGILASLVFRAKNQGGTSFAFRDVNFSAAGGKQLSVLQFSTVVDIK